MRLVRKLIAEESALQSSFSWMSTVEKRGVKKWVVFKRRLPWRSQRKNYPEPVFLTKGESEKRSIEKLAML